MQHQCCVRERHSALPCGMVSCLVEPRAGPGQRTTIPQHPYLDALRAGPPTTSRHYRVGPGFDYHRGHDPCHGASAVLQCPRALPVTAVPDGGNWGRGRLVYTHEPRHVATAIQWCLYGYDGHCAARVDDKADCANLKDCT
jgi:hypothetical protein